jgi:L-gulonolactone oxidase
VEADLAAITPSHRGAALTFVEGPATSWGRVLRPLQRIARPRFAAEIMELRETSAPRLAVGLRRSYGDTALAANADIIDMTALNRLIAFDPQTGILRAEAGLSFDDLMTFCAPRGFFPATCPGTRYITLGGAIANDVHGKNHHRAGAFGSSVLGFTLLRSDRGVIDVTLEREPDLFAATIGGLGLTGIILDATIRLTRIASTNLDVETIAFKKLDEFFSLAAESEKDFEHTVAWIDCTNRAGRGIFQRANWAASGPLKAHAPPGLARLPVDAPNFALNPVTLTAFNNLYYLNGAAQQRHAQQPYAAVFHPLDSISDWNRLYGSRGFFQYQCVVPYDAQTAVSDMLSIIQNAGEGSFLAVLKSFGAVASPGLLSFPMPGYTLALDFANRGAPTLDLLAQLDAIVSAAAGRLYPAKDGRFSREMFERGYPQLARFSELRDPLCISDFWRRMT